MTTKTKSIIKYLFALILLVAILYRTDFSKVSHYMENISPLYLILALFLVTMAQFVAALRMAYFFHAEGFPLSNKFAVILYYVGSFYNFLLPGGIGGDAYKVILARKRMEMPTMQGIKIMIADRASGLCVIMMMLYVSAYLIDFSTIPYANWLILMASIVTLAAYLIISKTFLKKSPKVMLLSIPYSFVTQMLWIATLATLWQALSNGKNFIDYVALYCAASVASMIPASPGGLGIKEATYFYGAKLIHQFAGVAVDPELGVALSLCIFFISLVCALPGILWLHKVSNLDYSPQENSGTI